MDNNIRFPSYISHHGIKGQKWGIRREKESTSGIGKRKIKTGSLGKTLGIAAGGAAIGAAAVGAAWFLRNKHLTKMRFVKRSLAAKKGAATRAARKASGYYNSFKNVDVAISKGSTFIKQFNNVKLATIVTG